MVTHGIVNGKTAVITGENICINGGTQLRGMDAGFPRVEIQFRFCP